MGKKNRVVYESLVNRDKQIIELIEKVGVITREQIQKVLFKNTHDNVPRRRLTFLTENKLIKRDYYQLEQHKNLYVYYLDKKPSKRNIQHELLVTEFIVNTINISEILEIKTHYKIGDIISDAYIEYTNSEGRIKRMFLEVQRSGKTSDCVNKYRNIRNIILNERKNWEVIPRLIVITDLDHNYEQLKNIKIKYDTTQMKNIRELLF